MVPSSGTGGHRVARSGRGQSAGDEFRQEVRDRSRFDLRLLQREPRGRREPPARPDVRGRRSQNHPQRLGEPGPGREPQGNHRRRDRLVEPTRRAKPETRPPSPSKSPPTSTPCSSPALEPRPGSWRSSRAMPRPYFGSSRPGRATSGSRAVTNGSSAFRSPTSASIPA